LWYFEVSSFVNTNSQSTALNIPDWQQRISTILSVVLAFTLYVGGLFFTSRSFHDLVDNRKGHGYLGLPSSALEKYFAKWVVSGPLYFLAVIALVSLAAFLILGALSLYQGVGLNMDHVYRVLTGYAIWPYIVIHSIFLLGAIAFRRYNFWKTILMLFASGIALSFLMYFIMRVVFHEYADGWAVTIDNGLFPDHHWDFTNLKYLGRVLFALFAIGLSTVGYFKLKEKEV